MLRGDGFATQGGVRMFRLAILILWLPALAVCGEVIDAKSAAARIGDKVVIEGIIHEIVIRESGTVFLNFGAAYPDEALAAVVMKDTRPRFPGIESWQGKKVRVEGIVSDHDGRPRIILRERGQIALVE